MWDLSAVRRPWRSPPPAGRHRPAREPRRLNSNGALSGAALAVKLCEAVRPRDRDVERLADFEPVRRGAAPLRAGLAGAATGGTLARLQAQLLLLVLHGQALDLGDPYNAVAHLGRLQAARGAHQDRLVGTALACWTSSIRRSLDAAHRARRRAHPHRPGAARADRAHPPARPGARDRGAAPAGRCPHLARARGPPRRAVAATRRGRGAGDRAARVRGDDPPGGRRPRGGTDRRWHLRRRPRRPEAVPAEHDGRRHPLGPRIRRSASCSTGQRASTSPETPTSSTGWRCSRAASTSPCSPSPVGPAAPARRSRSAAP